MPPINLGNVAGIVRSETPPAGKPYVLWGKITNPLQPLLAEPHVYSGSGDPADGANWTKLGDSSPVILGQTVHVCSHAPAATDTRSGIPIGDMSRPFMTLGAALAAVKAAFTGGEDVTVIVKDSDLNEHASVLEVDCNLRVVYEDSTHYSATVNPLLTIQSNGYSVEVVLRNSSLTLLEASIAIVISGALSVRVIGGKGHSSFPASFSPDRFLYDIHSGGDILSVEALYVSVSNIYGKAAGKGIIFPSSIQGSISDTSISATGDCVVDAPGSGLYLFNRCSFTGSKGVILSGDVYDGGLMMNEVYINSSDACIEYTGNLPESGTFLFQNCKFVSSEEDCVNFDPAGSNTLAVLEFNRCVFVPAVGYPVQDNSYVPTLGVVVFNYCQTTATKFLDGSTITVYDEGSIDSMNTITPNRPY